MLTQNEEPDSTFQNVLGIFLSISGLVCPDILYSSYRVGFGRFLFCFYFFLSLASKSALALFMKRTFLNFHKNIFPSLFTSLSCAPCTDKGNSEIFCDFRQILVEKTVPYLDSLVGSIYEKMFNAVVNFIYFG